MKTKEEYATLNKKLAELTDEELKQVTGGYNPGSGSCGGSYGNTPGQAPSAPSTPTESYTVPIKGDDTDHIDSHIHLPQSLT